MDARSPSVLGGAASADRPDTRMSIATSNLATLIRELTEAVDIAEQIHIALVGHGSEPPTPSRPTEAKTGPIAVGGHIDTLESGLCDARDRVKRLSESLGATRNLVGR